MLKGKLARVSVKSAGTAAVRGAGADPTAIHLMKAKGYDLTSHRAQQISETLCQEADLILVMDMAQRRLLGARFPTVTGRVFRLGEFEATDIQDPYGHSPEMFRHVLEKIERGVESWNSLIAKLTLHGNKQ